MKETRQELPTTPRKLTFYIGESLDLLVFIVISSSPILFLSEK